METSVVVCSVCSSKPIAPCTIAVAEGESVQCFAVFATHVFHDVQWWPVCSDLYSMICI